MNETDALLNETFELLGFKANQTGKSWTRSNVEVMRTDDGRFHARPTTGTPLREVLFSADSPAQIIRMLRTAEQMFRSRD